MANVTGKTSSGFEYSVDERIFTDWRYMELFADVLDGTAEEKAAAVPKWGKFILGKEGLKALLDHVAANNDGFAPTEIMVRELSEIAPKQKTDSKN